MLSRPLSDRSRPHGALPDVSGAGSARPAPPAQLDPEALQRLRELDPTGASRLMERVVKAFNASVSRLLPQLHAARDNADPAGIRHVAHTLKSSSASIGAVKLALLCAEMEAMARKGSSDDMNEKIATLSHEVFAVLEALKLAPDSPP